MIDENGNVFDYDETSLAILAKSCDSYGAVLFQSTKKHILPDIPSDIIQWNYACRPTIKGEPNRLKVSANGQQRYYRDQHPWIQLLMGKTVGERLPCLQPYLAMQHTTNYDYDQTYVNFELEALKTFSDNKFQKGRICTVSSLSEYIEGISKYGSMSKVTTEDSLHNRHGHCIKRLEDTSQGKSNKKMVD